MLITKKIKKMLVYNWLPKLICLLAAIAVWMLVDRLFVRGDIDEWNLDEIRGSIPE